MDGRYGKQVHTIPIEPTDSLKLWLTMKKQIWSDIAKNGALLDRRYSNKVPEVVDKGTSLSVALVGLCAGTKETQPLWPLYAAQFD